VTLDSRDTPFTMRRTRDVAPFITGATLPIDGGFTAG
jgi:hypothetical protein